MAPQTTITAEAEAFEVTSESESSSMTEGCNLEGDTVDLKKNEQERDITINTMMMDDGYTADVEESVFEDDQEEELMCSDEEDESQKIVYPSTFPPPCRKRQRDLEEEDRHNTSLMVLSKFLVQYWDALKESRPPKKKQKKVLTTPIPLYQNVVLPQVSCRHVSLEEALAFTPLPRIVLQAQPPHSVVHANAAYARFRGSNTTTMFTLRHHHASTSLLNAIQSCFGGIAREEMVLIMYPVCGEEEFRMVTHYLVEASTSMPNLVESSMNTIPSSLLTAEQTTLPMDADQPARTVG